MRKERKKLNRKVDNVQSVLEIEGIKLILIEHESGKKYLPLSQVDQKALLRQKGSTSPKANKENVEVFNVKFGLINKEYNNQESNCIEIDELKTILANKTQASRLSHEQIESQNKLHRYLNIPEIPLIDYDTDKYDIATIDKHDDYTQSIIKEVVEDNEYLEGRVCTKCNKQYPLHETFFYESESSSKRLERICSLCKQTSRGAKDFRYKSSDETINKLNRSNASYDDIVNYNNNEVETLYDLFLDGNIRWFPNELRTRENLFTILDKLYEEGKIKNNNLTAKLLSEEYKLVIRQYDNTSITEIYSRYYGEEFYLEKWKYPMYTFSEIKLTPEMAKIIFDNYLKAHNVKIDDPINFDYQSVIDACHLKSVTKVFGGLCGFFVYYWEGKYAGYQFRNIGNYYRIDRNNVLSDLRFLVKKDLKLKIEKIPLYITKNFMATHCSSLYAYLKRNGNNYYDFFNELYPNRFNPTDFEITKYRNNFDSIEEEQVDGILREYFDNVVYNYNNSDQVVTLKNKRPDWFIMTEDGVWLVEYFGMYIERQIKNDIIRSYIDGTHEKLKAYEELNGYNFLFVYPSDLEKGFLGLRVKIDEIINKGRIISA